MALQDILAGLTKGTGTPWGATDYGKPDRPGYITDPNQVTSGFDYSPLANSYKRAFLGRQGNAKEQALASMSRAGIASGADTGRALSDIAAKTETGLSDIDANMAWKQWQDKLDMMDRLNRLKQAEYQEGMKDYESEQAGRGAALKGLFSAGTSLGSEAAKAWGSSRAGK